MHIVKVRILNIFRALCCRLFHPEARKISFFSAVCIGVWAPLFADIQIAGVIAFQVKFVVIVLGSGKYSWQEKDKRLCETPSIVTACI